MAGHVRSRRRPLLTLLLIELSLVGDAAAECQRPPANTREYGREHTVHHFNGDPPSQAWDTLALWETPAGDRRFSLCTVGPNYHTCCALTIEPKGPSLVLSVSSGWERVGAGGVCPRQVSCGADPPARGTCPRAAGRQP